MFTIGACVATVSAPGGDHVSSQSFRDVDWIVSTNPLSSALSSPVTSLPKARATLPTISGAPKLSTPLRSKPGCPDAALIFRSSLGIAEAMSAALAAARDRSPAT